MKNRRNHKFDLLRIVFAVFVLLAHAFILTDGNNSRELLMKVTNSGVHFGSLGVDGFFLLSGYLIVQSWLKKPSALDFTIKRLLRIAPGYAAVIVLSTIVVGFAAPGVPNFFSHLGFSSLRSTIFLFRMSFPPVFPGNPYPALNGSLWTILYEFRCYMVVLAAGVLGILRPRLWLVATVTLLAFLIVPAMTKHLPWPSSFYSLLGNPTELLRLASIFFVGGCFFLFRERIPFRPAFAIVAVCGLFAIRFGLPVEMEAAFVLLGGYLLFYFGAKPSAALAWMSRVPDISYGIYLYGWPVESYLVWRFHSSPWLIFLESTAICFGLGWLSWTFVESPAMKLRPNTTVSRKSDREPQPA
jgi:peptidoglycan/LPS O-acetylase OafA/YrhL